MKLTTRKDYIRRRHMRLRRKIRGTAERPRMCVSVSNRHIYVQLIDDASDRTLVAVSTLAQNPEANKNVGGARALGEKAAELALEKGIRRVVLDRGGHRFHGRVKAIADAAREKGLEF